MTDQAAAADAVADDALLPDNQPEPQDDTTPAADAGAEPDADDEGEGDKPQPRRSRRDERIDELTWRLRETERRLEAATAPKEPAAQPAAEASTRPNPDTYPGGVFDEQYLEDLTDWKAEQVVDRRFQQQAAQTQARTAQQAFQDRQAEFSKAKPDFDAKVYRSNWDCTPVMKDALITSDQGPAVAYHLASNPDEARRIAAMDSIAQIRAIGRLEAQLTPASDNKPSAKTITDAPDPAPQVRSARGTFAPTLRDDLPTEEWLRIRNAQVRG